MIKDKSLQQQLITTLPFLAGAGRDFQTRFFSACQTARIPGGQVIATDHTRCEHLAIVVEGQVRVLKLSSEGREITLYRITASDSCILTASCIISEAPFPATAVTETDVLAILVPAASVRQWLPSVPEWASFVFGLISRRLSEVIAVLESTAFQHIGARLAGYLLKHGGSGTKLRVTHQEIAAELGTTREVISRIIKQFERNGLVSLRRGEIVLLDAEGIQAVVDG